MPINQDTLYQAIDELRAIATTGLYYARTEYDKERYQQILSVALGLFAALEERPFEEVQREFVEDNWLHMSPAAGAEAVIVHEEKIMLIKRRDNGLWAVPGGLVEVGETLAGAAQRELWEETGIRGQVTRLLGIFDSRVWQSKTKAHLYHAIFLAEATDLNPRTSSEATEVAFFGENNLPELSPGHQHRVPLLFKILRGEIPAPYFDLPSRE
ncbi:MAG TPA: NUDIX hydrolase N-terminal domain-containing protein [Anaerolineales bacterium]|nr:NUDIX hydrolase N-terminal domain-containing protein [Anaerolineales bacterium]